MSRNPQPVVVLVEPQLGENIGMCARAMLNCGLRTLRLVRPRDGWPNPAARAAAAAADADVVIDGAEVFASLDESLADCSRILATTARSRSLAVPVSGSAEAAGLARLWSGEGSRVAVLFGAEASGLDNDSVARADRILRFETNPAFPSLNLAQSVLLFAWEWSRAAAPQPADEDRAEPPAPRGKLEPFLGRLERALDERGFFLTPELKPKTQNTLRSLFSRAAPSDRELALLEGALTALLRHPRRPDSDQ